MRPGRKSGRQWGSTSFPALWRGYDVGQRPSAGLTRRSAEVKARSRSVSGMPHNAELAKTPPRGPKRLRRPPPGRTLPNQERPAPLDQPEHQVPPGDSFQKNPSAGQTAFEQSAAAARPCACSRAARVLKHGTRWRRMSRLEACRRANGPYHISLAQRARSASRAALQRAEGPRSICTRSSIARPRGSDGLERAVGPLVQRDACSPGRRPGLV
jgi:hypothetical protein